MDENVVLLDLSDSDMTLSEAFHLVEKYQMENPNAEIYLDGDRKAIMIRRHFTQTTLD